MSDILKLSVSKSKTFESCQKKYHFSYNLKLPRKDFEFYAFGKFLHQVLEDFHNEYINGTNDSHNTTMVRCYKNALIEYGPKLSDASKEEAKAIVAIYLKKLNTDPKLDIKLVTAVEKNFTFLINEKVSLTGMIDRVQIDPDGVLHLLDYKTIKNKKYLKNDFLQLLTYAYAMYVEDNSINRVRGSYVLLRHNFEYFTKEFDLNEILTVKKTYEDYATAIENEKLWAPNPSFLCNYCEFNDHCDAANDFLRDKVVNGIVKW